jgi:transposase InsO family protein
LGRRYNGRADLEWLLVLSLVLDVFSRRVVGWVMATHLRTELVLDALEMAIHQRSPRAAIHHSDLGCQYTSIAFGKRCQEAGIRPSMGSVGDCFDNAMCESFNATLECELLVTRRFKNQRKAGLAVFDFIEGWYNPHRRHTSIGNISPVEYERRNQSRPMCNHNTVYESEPAPERNSSDRWRAFTMELGRKYRWYHRSEPKRRRSAAAGV